MGCVRLTLNERKGFFQCSSFLFFTNKLNRRVFPLKVGGFHSTEEQFRHTAVGFPVQKKKTLEVFRHTQEQTSEEQLDFHQIFLTTEN